MIKSIFTLAIISSLIITSCNTTSNKNNNEPKNTNTSVSDNDIPFVEAHNYYVKNTYVGDQLSNPKITTQKDFEDIFGMATTMGNDGKPTEIDFSKQYVIAIIDKITDKLNTLKISSLKQKDSKIVLTYEFKEGKKLSYSIQQFILLIVDNKYQGEVIIEKI